MTTAIENLAATGSKVRLGSRWVGDGHPVYVIGEIGINHNGDAGIATRLIAIGKEAGLDAVKFQKRTPEDCVPPEQRGLIRETPWGAMTYLDYRRRLEFGETEYGTIDAACREAGVDWFASCWDPKSVDFIERYSPVCYKVPSASLTDTELLLRLKATGRPVILSTGMSTMVQIEQAVATLGTESLILMHTTSAYPCPIEKLDLRMIGTLRGAFGVPVGYSGHEVGLATTVAAVALGACAIERHITLDRAMWGSDQAASVEPVGLSRLVRDIRAVELALGSASKQVHAEELAAMKKLRRVM